MQNAEPTLHDYVLRLLTEASCREAFDTDPVAALRDAGLEDVSPEDVVDAIPLVLDFASASGTDFNLHNHLAGEFGDSTFSGGIVGNAAGVATGGSFDTPMAVGGFRAEGGTDGSVDTGAGIATEHGNLLFGAAANSEGVAVTVSSNSTFATGGYDLTVGPGGITGGGGFDLTGLDALGLDTDAIGRGGDLVTGTVAGYLNDGAETLAGALTDGAAVLSGGLGHSAETVGDLIVDGAGRVSDVIEDPTSITIPTVPPSLPELPVELPIGGLPALPALPALPGVPELPDLGDLPVNLPSLPDLDDLPGHLPVDLPDVVPGLPEVPALPEIPALPSVPGVGSVTDVVGGVTSHIPIVGDLTDGLGDGLLGH